MTRCTTKRSEMIRAVLQALKADESFVAVAVAVYVCVYVCVALECWSAPLPILS